MNVNKWWLETLQKKRELLEKLENPYLQLEEMIDVQKKLSAMEEISEIAERAEVLFSDIESLKDFEDAEDQIKQYSFLI